MSIKIKRNKYVPTVNSNHKNKMKNWVRLHNLIIKPLTTEIRHVSQEFVLR